MDKKQTEEMAKIICPSYGDKECYKSCFYSDCIAEVQSEELYNAGYHKPERISVEDRLPDIDPCGKGRYGGTRSVRVLCTCKQRDGRTFVKEGYYEPCGNENVVWRIPGSIDSVTHWMPLPSPPTEKEN